MADRNEAGLFDTAFLCRLNGVARICSSLTFPSWRGQQQRAWNGIANPDHETPKADKNELFALFDTIYKRIYE